MDYILRSLIRTKGFPLDKYSRITTLSQINVEIPSAVRYDGMQFYVISEGKYYHFGPDLVTPLTTDFNSKSIVFEQVGGVYNYTNLLTRLSNLPLNELYYISPLNIYVFNSLNPVCIEGSYKLTTINEWTTIPSQLKLVGSDVYIQDTGVINIVDNSKNLTSEVISVIILPSNPVNRRYYKMGSDLYYCVGGILYKLTGGDSLRRHITGSITLNKHPLYDRTLPLYQTPQIITHDIGSKSLKVELIDSSNNHINIGYKIVDDNKIELISAASLSNVNIVITSI